MQQDNKEFKISSRLKSEKPKRVMTEKQQVARLANLEKGRKKRLETIKHQKDQKGNGVNEEYDLSSDYSNESPSSESDNDAFIISKKKRVPRITTKSHKPQKRYQSPDLRNEVDEIKNMVIELAKMQQKQNKTKRKTSRKKSGGTKIVVLPQNTSASPPVRGSNDCLIDALRKSLM
jgi:hypothetical protein